MAGRKNKYFTNIEPNLYLIAGYLNSGHTEASVAKMFGVGVSTWERHKNSYEDFRELIRKSGMNATALVVNSIHKRATGYEYEEITTEITDNGPQKGKQGRQRQAGNQRRVIKKVTKHVPPDTAAGIFWLTNRDPEQWKNTQNIRHSGEIKNSGVLMTSLPMDKDEWLQFYKENVEEKQEQASNESRK